MEIDTYSTHPLIQLEDEDYRECYIEKHEREPRWVPVGWNNEGKRRWTRNYRAPDNPPWRIII